MDELDRAIVNRLQQGFPLEREPFKAVGAALGISEHALIERIERLLFAGILTRFGPLYHIERMGGRFTLAAMSVRAEDFEGVAATVNAFAEVAHNYERDHMLNMWFVLATEGDRSTAAVVKAIEQASGYRVLLFPKEREYFVHLMLAA